MQIKPFVFRTLSLLVFLFTSSVSFAQDQTFEDWLMELRADARSQGISDETLDAAFATVEAPIPRVLELDRSQPEFVQTFTGYMRNRMSQARIERGQALLEEHRELFQRIQNEYGVQPHYLVSFWALESNFGDFTGGFSVINALATLAYDPRRNDMFRSELITALRIIEEGHISAEQMSGSWAGAMGQCQFMPTTFYRYAKDGDGDGRIDIWNSVPDVFASAANFLSQSGWRGDERWGREVILPEGFDFTLTGTGVRKTVTEWNSLGITRVNKSPLGNADLEGSIVLPAGSNGPAFLAYNNFRTTMVWNRSTYYAISVGHLADRFVGGGPIMYMPENEERPMSRELVTELQTLLNAQGVDAGTPDGILGSRTRAAVRAYQEQANLPTDGYPSFELLEQLREL
ncbi:lytic murein transglycosylase [Gammaproteobacteria bacterium]|nr:lytic murein transglycosylase [Gammaproteobacteria bacterium]